jgi:hypothetical protein
MIPRTLREIIKVSRKTAKEFKQALEDVAELIHEKQLEQSLRRQPARVPIRNQHSGHPLARGNNNRRNFSTARIAKFNARNISLNLSARNAFALNPTNVNFASSVNNSIKPTISKTFKAAIYQTQPFRTSTRVQLGFIRGGVGSGMYKHFPKHNARMFSTFGPNLTHQAVENLSQSLRVFFLKGGKFSADCLHSNIHNNSNCLPFNDSDLNFDHAIHLASTVSETSGLNEYGCIVEFNLSTPSIQSMIPESGYFDDSNLDNLYSGIENSITLQKRILHDIKLFKENIGSTSFKFHKDRNRLQFYCPNCDVLKMECLLQDSGISTGLVFRNDEYSKNLISTSSDSEFSGPDLESDSSSVSSFSSSNSILSSSISGISNYYMMDTTTNSILSSSDEYFDAQVLTTVLRV